MKIIDPAVEFYTESNPLRKIERVARICWNTESKISDVSARPFCEKLLKMGHMSPFEHARVNVPWGIYTNLASAKAGTSTPYGHAYRRSFFCDDQKGDFFQINARDFLSLGGTLDQLSELENADDYTTVLFTIDIGISRELIRHRQMSFMERSTRYVNMGNLEVVRPLPFEWTKGGNADNADNVNKMYFWQSACSDAEEWYSAMLKKGAPPQEARSVLPLSTATRLYVTGMFEQWRDMLKLRTAPGAHPSMQYAMKLLLSNPDCPEEIKK